MVWGLSTPQFWQLTKAGWAKVWEDATAFSIAPKAAYHPSGKWVAMGSETELTVRRADDGTVVWKCPLKAPPQDVAFAPDGRHLFVANGFNTVYVLRLPDLSGAADRAAAEWVLSLKGDRAVGVRVAGEAEIRTQIKAAAELPKGAISLFPL